jgi:pimeloyl-ACP methyl ester carboxylesterase
MTPVLTEAFSWRGRTVRWERMGAAGPAVVFCHGTPWSSELWRPFATALATDWTVYLWDMPGYGRSSKEAEHHVGLDVQGELFADLLAHWGLRSPHVIAHDYGGAVALRAHLLHGAEYASLALVDVVALAPWGSPFFQLVRENAEVFGAVPPAIHEGMVRAYIEGASHRGLNERDVAQLVEPWRGADGQAAFYRQIAQADQKYTDEIEPRYAEIRMPVLVAWGQNDTWIPVDRAHRLHALIPGARMQLIEGAGHLVHLDQPAALATCLTWWLDAQV